MLMPTIPPRHARTQALFRSLGPAIVEAHAVDDGAVFLQTEQARLGIARLRQGRDRTNLGKAKAKPSSASGTSPSLSKPAAMPTGVESQTRHRAGQRPAGRDRGPRNRQIFERSQRHSMRGFGIETEQGFADQGIGHGPEPMTRSAGFVDLHNRSIRAARLSDNCW
jgi:hypothetical protein